MTATIERPSPPPAPAPAASAAAPPGPPRPATPSTAAAELALGALGMVTAVGLCRVFLGWDFLLPCLLATASAHLLAALGRRRRWPFVVTAIAQLAALIELVAVLQYRDTTAFGLPTATTWDLALDELGRAWSAFPTAVAPVPTEGGFLAVGMIAVWLVAVIGDVLAFRVRLAFESTLPTAVVFVFCAAIGADRHRIGVTVAWIATAAVTVALLRAQRELGSSGWLAGGQRRSRRALVRNAVVLTVPAVVVGALIGPRLPGAGEDAVIETKNASGGRRVTDNPFVTLRSRLSNPTTAELFRVRSDHKSYWRLNALDTFDGTSWTLSPARRDGDDAFGAGELPADLSQAVTQVVTMGELDSSWVPMAYKPIELSGLGTVRYDAEIGAALVERGRLSAGTTYTVVSRVPAAISPEVLRQRLSRPTGLDPVWTRLPTSFPSRLVDLAGQITAQQRTPYDQALALQQFFRDNFTYDLQVGAGSSNSALLTFLENRRGYCEQFASAYAAFARAIGLPARVAVGYTSGVLGDDGTYRVQGRHAHAWPEVYFDGIGWLPFEPTPSRGNPDAETYTFVQGQQVDEVPVDAPTTTAVDGSDAATDSTLPAFDFDAAEFLPVAGSDLGGGTAAPETGRSAPWGYLIVLGATAAVLATWLVGVPALQRRRWDRRRRQQATVAGAILVSWDQALDALRVAGIRVAGSDTPLELVSRLARTPRVDTVALDELAQHATSAAYARTAPEPEALTRAEDARRRMDAALDSGNSWFRRARRRASVRALVRPLPTARPTR